MWCFDDPVGGPLTEKPEWSATWPTEPGWYWTHGKSPRSAPYVSTCEVRKAGSKGSEFLIYVQEGTFLYPEESARRSEKIYWKPLPDPELDPNVREGLLLEHVREVWANRMGYPPSQAIKEDAQKVVQLNPEGLGVCIFADQSKLRWPGAPPNKFPELLKAQNHPEEFAKDLRKNIIGYSVKIVGRNYHIV